MAAEKIVLRWSAKTAEDLHTYQYKLVKLNESGELVKAGAGDLGYVLVDEPKEKGIYGTIMLEGIGKAIAKKEIKAGEYLVCTSESLVEPATLQKVEAEKVVTGGSHVVGKALTKVTAEGQLVTFTTATGLV